MAIYKISLNEEGNQEYYALAKEQSSLMLRVDDIREKIHQFEKSKLLLFKKKELKSISISINKLQKDFFAWKVKACAFCYNPQYEINPEQEQQRDLIFLHYNTNMRDLVNYLESSMNLIAEAYVIIYFEYQNHLNFFIAIGAFSLSFIGLVIGIFAFLR